MITNSASIITRPSGHASCQAASLGEGATCRDAAERFGAKRHRIQRSICASEKAKQPHLAIELLAVMQQKGLAPSAITYSLAVGARVDPNSLMRRGSSMPGCAREAWRSTPSHTAQHQVIREGQAASQGEVLLAEARQNGLAPNAIT